MTNTEALELFKNHQYMTEFTFQDDMSEIAIKAIEKQTPKKIIHFHHCPNCGTGLPTRKITAECCSECYR